MEIVILDGYVDEPAGLGVPPYVDVYPRYIAGAVWSVEAGANITYFTVDQVRSNLDLFMKTASRADVVVFIAGVVVPGKYLGGEPIKVEELLLWSKLLERPIKILGGPVARFGIGEEGGKIATPPSTFKEYFDLVATGDVEMVVYHLIKEKLRVEYIDPSIRRKSYSEISNFAIKGAKIVLQHPNYGFNLIAEIETFRGCPRRIVGGCSFCIEPQYGRVTFRSISDIVKEVEALYNMGVRHFRLGRQPDFYIYMSKQANEEEFPKPNPSAIKKLLEGIRSVAPRLETLHIDNVNPGTIFHHKEEAIEITKILLQYHTPGDVAAMGIESADPKVIKLNGLKVMPEEAFEAIKIINAYGSKRGWNGLPELLPGINFVTGLIGENAETYRLNFIFLKKILNEGLMVRRINIRQVLPLPNTRMWLIGDRLVRKNKKYFKRFKDRVRKEIDLPMLKKVVPKGTILRSLYTETYEGKNTLARQSGSYPLLTYIPDLLPLKIKLDVVVVDHGYRSVTGVPYPLNVNKASRRLLSQVPFLSRKDVEKIIVKRPFVNLDEVALIISNKKALQYLSV
ncbi:MAG: radical SAM protein [Thermoprotei archaeon]|nr:MAG: radical SAM protein [Thermoprotei archaeon]